MKLPYFIPLIAYCRCSLNHLSKILNTTKLPMHIVCRGFAFIHTYILVHPWVILWRWEGGRGEAEGGTKGGMGDNRGGKKKQGWGGGLWGWGGSLVVVLLGRRDVKSISCSGRPAAEAAIFRTKMTYIYFFKRWGGGGTEEGREGGSERRESRFGQLPFLSPGG